MKYEVGSNHRVSLEKRTPTTVRPHTPPNIMYRAILQQRQVIFRDPAQLFNARLAENSSTWAVPGSCAIG
jgi:hypothetical protein